MAWRILVHGYELQLAQSRLDRVLDSPGSERAN